MSEGRRRSRLDGNPAGFETTTGIGGTAEPVAAGVPGGHGSSGDHPMPERGRWSRVLFHGDDDRRHALARTMLARLAAIGSAEDLLIALCVAPSRQADWAWTRWLPHTRRPPVRPGDETESVSVSSVGQLPELLGAGFAARPAFVPDVRLDRREPLVVVVVDGADLPAGERLAGPGYRNTVVLDLTGVRRRPGRTTLRLDVGPADTRAAWLDQDRTERSAPVDDAGAAVLLLRRHPSEESPDITRPDLTLPDIVGARGDANEPPDMPGDGLAALLDAATGPGEWPPPLADPPSIDQLLPLVPTRDRGLSTVEAHEDGWLTVPVGVIDQPFEQVRGILRVDLAGEHGHVLIAGAAGSGKSTLVTTLVLALAVTRTPREVQFYCLDFSGALGALSGLPHVGALVDRSEPERAGAVVARVGALVEHRERLFRDHGVAGMADYRRRRAELPGEPYGDVFLVVDGVAGLGEHASVLDRIAADGIEYGVHLVLTGAHWPTASLGAATRLELRLDDPAESMAGPNVAVTVPQSPGRGLTASGLHFLTALPRADSVQSADGLGEAVSALVTEISDHWAGRPGAPGIHTLPAQVTADSLPEPEGLRVALGLADGELTPVVHDFAAVPHLIVTGGAGSGRTNLLRLIAWSITEHHSPAEVRLLLVDRDGGLPHSMPDEFTLGHASSPDILREMVDGTRLAIAERVPGPDARRGAPQWRGPRLFILVDDHEPALSPEHSPFEPLIEYLEMGYEVGAHFVVVRSSADAAASTADPLIRGLRDAGAATLLLSAPEGGVLDGIEARVLPPGRASYRSGDETLLVQTALAGDSGI